MAVTHYDKRDLDKIYTDHMRLKIESAPRGTIVGRGSWKVRVGGSQTVLVCPYSTRTSADSWDDFEDTIVL